MIRIVHIITSFDIGGAEQFVLDLCRRLDRKRFDVRVIAVVRGGPLRADFHEAGIPTDVVGKRTKLGIEVIRHLTADLQSPRPDIVHTHLFAGDTWGRIAAIRARVPRILSTEHNVNHDEGFVKRMMKRWLATRTERIVAVSDAVRSASVRVDRIPPGQVMVIPNGVDLDRYRPLPRTIRGGARLLAVGRLVPQKGFDILLDALAICRDTLPTAKLTIVGDGPLRAEFEAQARAFHLSDRIAFLGFRRDCVDRYHAADVMVCPSRWEGLGLAAIEASACGLPVIASAVDGLQEVIRDGETGMLVPPNDAAALARALVDLAGDPARQVLFGHAGRRRMEREFNIDRAVQRYEALYQSLVQP